MTAEKSQLHMWSETGHAAPHSSTPGFALVTEHRTLLGSLQDEWLQPPSGATGHLLRANGTFGGTDEPSGSQRKISVTLLFLAAELPPVDVLVHHQEKWIQTSSDNLPEGATALWWPGPLPLTSVAAASVATQEERIRLQSIARQVSNVDLPVLHVEPSQPSDAMEPPPESAQNELCGITVSSHYDSVRGAAAMAWWAVPRITPWYDLLVASICGSDADLANAAETVAAPWLVALPWRMSASRNVGVSLEQTLWRTSFEVLAGWQGQNATTLLDMLVQAAHDSCEDQQGLHAWAESTRDVLRAKSQIDLISNSAGPVATALQLFLARSDPERYKTWTTTDHRIPPAVWWSGALLSGAFSGYRRLPRTFRGDKPLRAFTAVHLSSQRNDNTKLTWSQRGQVTRFIHGSTCLAEKVEGTRGAWYRADLDDDVTQSLAIQEARRLGWPGIRRVLDLTAGTHRWSGSGALRIADSGLDVTGTVRLALNPADRVVDSLEATAFRRCLLTLGGHIEVAPPGQTQESSTQRTTVAPNVPDVPGLIYVPEFLSQREQEQVLGAVDDAEWSTELQRRVQHYGWRYDYKGRRVSKDMRLGNLPRWASGLAHRLHNERLVPWVPDQVIVNEYRENQGISRHIDLPEAFDGAIAMISLVESWHMRFRHKPSKKSVDHLLACGSVAVMTGAARYEWTHEIPFRKTENRRKRHRRVSLTFRRVRTGK